uniref:BTB domain-containing protein n=1 Tax=Electrophorus electricus TaxID=8005 RepID=A0A4W4FLF5_ELEEL
TMFVGRMRERHRRVVLLEEVSASSMEHLLEFIYVARVRLREESVAGVFQRGQRMVHLARLLGRLCLPLVDSVFFTDVLEADKLVQQCNDCWALLQEARLYHVYGREISSERTRPRRSSGWAEMIVVIGHNRSDISWTSLTEKLDPASGKWFPSATVPGYGKCEFAVCELQSHIYLSGGQLNSSDVWCLMPQLAQWVRVGRHKLLMARVLFACLRPQLYALGIYNGYQRLSSMECYSVFENAWKTVAPPLLTVSSSALARCSGKLSIIGGAVNNDRMQLSFRCSALTHVSSCPFSQKCIDAVSLSSTIYTAGGLLDKLYCYTPRNDTWSKVAELSMKLVHKKQLGILSHFISSD